MRCFKCNYDNVEGSIFCISCGTKLDAGVNMSADATVTQPSQVDVVQDRPFSGQPIPTPAPQPTPTPQPQPASAMYQTAAYQTPSYPYFGDKNGKIVPKEYKPISMWGYFGYNILFAIPIIGFIVLIIFALGGTSNINVKNYARSFFCGLVIAVIIAVILVVAAGGMGMIFGFV